ncbi:unnamed protein product [Pieris macdunnoughi]|uniref:THAP-type domain-containing protein n=1 Tax=Pieris macdunnoughi TaxID=345717 RepID=A0A821XQY1_9NEOP|nr:unnamed protein product [Pieris macdunnoughi]
MNFKKYRWCAVPGCKNTCTKTPNKLFIKVPHVDLYMRRTWLKRAGKDPNNLSDKTSVYFCEDHFDLENDMENYHRYKIMGSVKRIKMKSNCIPSKFDCQNTSTIEPLLIVKEVETDLEDNQIQEYEVPITYAIQGGSLALAV